VIAIPSVRGTGSTGWSCPFKDRDVVDNAIPKAGRRSGGAPRWGFAPGRHPSPLGTRPVTMTGRGAFDSRPAQGRAGKPTRHAAHHSKYLLLLLTRASAWSDPARSRTQLSLLARLDLDGPTHERRLARTTMEPLPRAHRDRRERATRDGWCIESSCGKGVRAA
jgi:hypothetical protein